jgi:hypothetical protein
MQHITRFGARSDHGAAPAVVLPSALWRNNAACAFPRPARPAHRAYVLRLGRAGVSSKAAAGTSCAVLAQPVCRASAVVQVGASDSADVRASFSNWGSCLDVYAAAFDLPV